MFNGVTFVGPIAVHGQPPRGGYQACNLRTINALRARAFSVSALRYPEPSGSVLNKGASYFVGFTVLFWSLLWGHEKIVHITGLYKHFIYPELVFVIFARLKGCKVIYDIRAGSARKYFDEKSLLYRLTFRATLRLASTVMVEGAEYIDFVHRLTGKTPYLLPNHVSLSAAQCVFRPDLDRTARGVALAYAGRLVKNKGIETVLQAAALLRRRGIEVKMYIAGSGDCYYVSGLRERYADPDNEWLGAISPESVLNIFASSHFFLFPTIHPGEGHSNALTESMAAGCVPVASVNGFNRSVIGDCGRVLPKCADAAAYADAVQEIICDNKWGYLSTAAMQRVQERFETGLVVSGLIAYYDKLRDSGCR